MDDHLYNGDKIVGPFLVLDELPQGANMVYYSYASEDPVPAQDLEFNISHGYGLVILSGQRDRYGVVLRALKHCISHGSSLTHHGGEIYPIAVGYVEIRPNDEPEHNVLVLVATHKLEYDDGCNG